LSQWVLQLSPLLPNESNGQFSMPQVFSLASTSKIGAVLSPTLPLAPGLVLPVILAKLTQGAASSGSANSSVAASARS
jgi:hypothetical protein